MTNSFLKRGLSLTFSLRAFAIAGVAALLVQQAACEPGPATPVPALTPAPDSTSTPTPLPTELADFRTVEYDPEYPPWNRHGDDYVTVGPDGEVYSVNIETGERVQLTSDGYRKRSPALSADYLAWIDQRRQIELRSNDSGLGDDIFVLDRATGEQRRITEAPASRFGLQLSGHRLVWQDNRNELEGHYIDSDIYAYDLETNEEIPVAVAKGSQRGLVVDGDVVVWADNRNSPLSGAPNRSLPSPGCGNCPENRFDIYSYDFNTGEERVLVETGYFNATPALYGEHLGWLAFHPQQPRAIKLLNLTTGDERTVAQDPRISTGLSISDEFVVWTVSWPCDVRPSPHPDYTGVYAQGLESGEIWKLSDYIEPQAFVRGNVVFVLERCFGIRRAYAIFLD